MSSRASSSLPAGHAGRPRRSHGDVEGTAGRGAAPARPKRAVDDGFVPEKQIWRWVDDGGAVA